ncbi:hypothetical protein MNR01_00505 [Lysobacter sp. S4-A87]|uniref:hypothetical protein n=1 Tax=Lysobacter sp. S4-A87 TaxID=2925843 RepID=UPI001F53A38D|nr:hypothetical protein [Lysobacter sp. S4-A87]UNK49565.1 hypothetical protein MNR01_00505 [Lysobacter sp. S4-A87]
MSMVAAATLLLAACEKQAPVNSAPPEEITAPAPAANPQPDVNAEPVERAAPPMVKAVAMGEFEPGNPVATAVTGKLTIEDNMMRGDNGASFTTERVAIVNGADQYSPGSTYAQAMMVAADQEIELRRVLEETPPTQMPSNAMCGGSQTGFIALAKVKEAGGDMVKVIGLKGSDMPAASAKGIELCACTMYLAAVAPPKA